MFATFHSCGFSDEDGSNMRFQRSESFLVKERARDHSVQFLATLELSSFPFYIPKINKSDGNEKKKLCGTLRDFTSFRKSVEC